MKHFYPAYYVAFHCIAADCPDSCCQGWDVVIDSDTEAFYRSVRGNIGEKLRNAIYTDNDGDRVFRLIGDKRCPFWCKDKLCEIHKKLGEEHLCSTCAQFPRLKMEYADFTEHSLALACPEAARLILNTDNAHSNFVHTAPKGCEAYSAELMQTLLSARQQTALLLSADKPLTERLKDALTYNRGAQDLISPYDEGNATSDCAAASAELFSQLEYIDEGNRAIIPQACMPADLTEKEAQLTRLALYYLYRYYLTAVDTLDVLTPVKHLILSIIAVNNLAEHRSIEAAAQLYSKETEQSYENMEQIYDALAYDPRFSSENLLTLLS